MRLPHAALLCLLLTQPSTAFAAMPVKLSDGASWSQTIARTRTDERGGQTHAVTLTTVLKVTYNRPKGQPATLRQAFVSAEAGAGFTGADAAQAAAQAKLVFPATIEVDDSLTPTRVANWPDLRATMDAEFARLISDPKALEAARGSFVNLTDKQAAVFFKEQQLIALGQGLDLAAGQSRSYDDKVPNMMGGPPILTHGTFRMESYDLPKGRAVVTWTQTLDTASASASISATAAAMLARMAPEQAAKSKAALEGLTIDRSDSCRFEIDIPTGLATTADCTSTMQSGLPGKAAKRTDRWLISQTLPEAL
jgi:hypothetical protein